jgi:hypothetical protein
VTRRHQASSWRYTLSRDDTRDRVVGWKGWTRATSIFQSQRKQLLTNSKNPAFELDAFGEKHKFPIHHYLVNDLIAAIGDSLLLLNVLHKLCITVFLA